MRLCEIFLAGTPLPAALVVGHPPIPMPLFLEAIRRTWQRRRLRRTGNTRRPTPPAKSKYRYSTSPKWGACVQPTGSRSPSAPCTFKRDLPLIIARYWASMPDPCKWAPERNRSKATAGACSRSEPCLAPWPATPFQGCDAFGGPRANAMQGERSWGSRIRRGCGGRSMPSRASSRRPAEGGRVTPPEAETWGQDHSGGPIIISCAWMLVGRRPIKTRPTQAPCDLSALATP